MKTVRDILSEAPWIEIGLQKLDLEAEKGYLAPRILELLMGKEVTDKYGSKMQFTTVKDIVLLVRLMKKDAILAQQVKEIIRKDKGK